MAWTSKIIGHGKEDPEQLLSNPFNYRIHSGYQQQALEANIDQLGFIRSVTVNQRTGHIVDGHLRVILALRRGEPEIDVEYVDLSPDEERLALATIDPIAALAGADAPKLNETLHGIKAASPVLTEFLSGLAGRTGLYQTNNPSVTSASFPSGDTVSPSYPNPADVVFKEYDESVEREVQWLECPECGHRWPK